MRNTDHANAVHRRAPHRSKRLGGAGRAWLMGLALATTGCTASERVTSPAAPPPPQVPAPPVFANACLVTRIYDGDTFACIPTARTDTVVVRMLAIDAPETAQRLGTFSTAILRFELPIGQRIGLRFDVDSLDNFGRTLAWIETPTRSNLNVWLAEDGWVTDLVIAPNTAIASAVRSAVARARAEQRGLWARGFASCLPVDFRSSRCFD
jgi:endonuclease YncB( thermonuclease family)